jgi:hypothetical protein
MAQMAAVHLSYANESKAQPITRGLKSMAFQAELRRHGCGSSSGGHKTTTMRRTHEKLQKVVFHSNATIHQAE